MDDDSDDDGDPGSTDLMDAAPTLPAAVPGPPKITVDAIFGWRWPLSEEDQERIRWPSSLVQCCTSAAVFSFAGTEFAVMSQTPRPRTMNFIEFH